MLNAGGAETIGLLYDLTTSSSNLGLIVGQSYTASQLNSLLGGINTFQGTGSLIISIPEPRTLALMLAGISLPAIFKLRRQRT